MNKKAKYKHLVGKRIRIVAMPDDPKESEYIGREGEVDFIDDGGILHGTWGGLGLIPETDSWVVLD